ITTTPKVYVSFTKTNVDDNAQTLVVNGFINDSEALHMKDALNEELSVPTNVNAPEEDKTPTSIKVQWDKVEGATNYEIEVDGIINNVLSATNYNHEGLEYDSEHTYRVRARNVDGYSNWSEPLVTRSLLDPWRNTPKPVNIDWTGRIWGNHNVSLAFDNVLQSGDGGFHSNNGGINETLTVDYGKGYNLETVEYYPRDDAGNGTVTQMEFSTSLDGVNWSETRTFDWTADATVKTIDNVGPARYLRFIPRKSVGTFFSASEIKVSADEGRKPFAIGSIASQHRDYVADADFTNLKNYKGLSVKDNPTFETQIKNYAMDINMNDIYDVYDYTYTLYNLPEGVTNKKEGSATGKGTLVPSVESLSTEETFTIDVILENANNLDALGEVINYNPELLEFVDVTKGDIIESMTDLTVNKVYSDGTAYVNLAYVNRGDQAVCEGSGVAATITMKAKTDIANVRDAIDLSKVSLYGPDVLNSDPGLQPSDDALVSTTPNSSGAISAKRAIGPNKESIVTVEFDMVTTLAPNETNAIVSLGSSDSNYTAYSQMPVVIRMYKDGTFGAHNGSTFVQSNLRFNKNEYYHIKVTIDLEAKKWSAIVSDEAGKETVIADNYGFRSTAQVPENIGKIYLVNNEAQAGKFWLENIKLYDGETDTSINFGLDDFDITMTNEFLPNDDGSNVEKLIQNGKNNGYTKLFDGNKEGSSARDFELLWDIESNYVDGKLPEYIALPLTMHLDLKEDALVDQVKVYNANKANGYLTSAKAQLVYTDGTKGEEVVISDMQSVYEFNFDSAKDVDRIDITFLTAIKADGTAVNNMLTLAEIEATGHLATTEEDKLINSAVTNVEAIDNGSDSADRMFDGSLTTYWESPWSGAQATLPKDVVMTLNDVYSLDTLEFISHTIRNGGITKYEVYTSTDEENWTKVAEGTVDAVEYKQGKNVTVSVAMAGVNAKYVKLVALESVGRIESEDNMYARIAEMNLYGTKAEIIEVDKTALSEAIIAAEALNESDYTADSWAVLANALITAKEILTNEEATQVDVDAAKDALLIAIDALLPNTHKEALEIALELANKITEHDLENVVPAVVEEFIAARAEADEVYNDAKASQEQINKAFDRLAKAMHMLDFIKGDKTALKAFIDKVEGLKDSKDQYTQASWDALEEVLAKAVGVYDNPNAMQEEVNNAYKELVTAFLNLRLIPDKSLLEELINKAEGLNKSNYTKATFDGLTKALNEAKAVFDNPNVTQEQIDNAKATLEKAINSLEANVNTPVDNAVSTPVNNGDVTVSVETGDNSLTGIFATMALLSIAGYTILKRKEN
uniref:discoidin domain-containing protein n=2 Tax=Bacillati TaxID=1783272 RepID=UPI0025944C98